MYALVHFTDNILSICTTKDVFVYKEKPVAVKYTDKKKYAARVLALCGNRCLLEDIRKNLENKAKKFYKGFVYKETELSCYDVLHGREKGFDDRSRLYLDKCIVSCINRQEIEIKFKSLSKINRKYFEESNTLLEMNTSTFRFEKSEKHRSNTADTNSLQKDHILSTSTSDNLGNRQNANNVEHTNDEKPLELRSGNDDDKSIEDDIKNSKVNREIKEEYIGNDQSTENPVTENQSSENINGTFTIFNAKDKSETNFETETKLTTDQAQESSTQGNIAEFLQDADNGINNSEHAAYNPCCFEHNCTKSLELHEFRNIKESNIDIDNESTETLQQNLVINSTEINQFKVLKDETSECFKQTSPIANTNVKNGIESENVNLASNQKQGTNVEELINDFALLDNLNESEQKKDTSASQSYCDFVQSNLNDDGYLDLRETMYLIANDSWNNLNKKSSLPSSEQIKVISDEVVDGLLQEKVDSIYKMDLRKIGDPGVELSISDTDKSNNADIILNDILTGRVFYSKNTKSEESENTISPPKFCSTFIESSSAGEITNMGVTGNELYVSDQDYIPTESSIVDETVQENSTSNQYQVDTPTSTLLQTAKTKILTSIAVTSAPDDNELQVGLSTPGTYRKKHFCMYCHKMQTKLARHLEQVHFNEAEVQKFAGLEKKNQERSQIIAVIRKNGDYLYNTNRKFNKGELVVCRRPNERMQRDASSFMPCVICKGHYAKATLRHHFKKCSARNNIKREKKGERIIMVKGRAIAGRIHEKADPTVREKIMPYLREDEVVRVIRYDELIMLFANKQCEKYGTHQHHFSMIRARLRLLGRFLVALKSINSTITNFASVYVPRNYDDVIRAVKIVAGFNNEKGTFDHPAVASGLGTLLKHVGEILRSEYIKSEKEKEQQRVENFLKLQSENYGTAVNRIATETQTQNYRRKTVLLPSADDITKLHIYLLNLRKTHFEELQKKFSFEHWHQLTEVTLVSLQIFNRRRAGEIERIYIEDFEQYHGIDVNNDAFNELSKDAQQHAKKYVRFLIRGKLNRSVPVLVPSDILQCLNLIIKHRKEAGVPEQNPYLFGMRSNDPSRHKYLRACNLIRKYSVECGAEVPETLRGTILRKHIATKCIKLNLSENQISDLANFMGHHDNIHKKIYRQPLIETDIVKISKLLEIAQGIDELSDSDEERVLDAEENPNSTSQYNNNEECGTITSPQLDNTNSHEVHHTSDKVEAIASNKKRPWSVKEKHVVLTAFKTSVQGSAMPSGSMMQELIDKHPCLAGRTVPQLRTWLYTQKKKQYIDD